MPPDTIIPKTISLQPSQVTCGANVTVTVSGTAVQSSDTTIGVSTTTPSAYSSLPSSVPVPAGASQVSFQATIDPNFTGSAQVAASGDGNQYSHSFVVSPPD